MFEMNLVLTIITDTTVCVSFLFIFRVRLIGTCESIKPRHIEKVVVQQTNSFQVIPVK